MLSGKGRILPAALVCVVGIGRAVALADDASNQQLQQKVDQLEAKVQTLEQQQSQNQAAITTAMAQVIDQADDNSQLMAIHGGTAGYDPATGFHIGSDDGNFYMHPFVLAQFEGIGTYRDDVPAGQPSVQPASGSSTDTGFQIRHLQMGIDGHILTPNLKYDLMVEGASSSLFLDDAFVTYRLGDTSPYSVKAGQFVDIPWHEDNVDDGHQLAADRSLVDALIGGTTISGTRGGATSVGFDPDRVLGVSGIYNSDPIRAEVALTNGYGSQNGPFYGSSYYANPDVRTNFGLAARAEYRVMGGNGAWRQYDQFSSLGAKTDSLVVGGGLEWSEAESNDDIYYTVDAQYNSPTGLGVYAAVLGHYQDYGLPGQNNQTASNFGFLLEGSYMINPKLEAFARYDFTYLDNSTLGKELYGGQNTVNEMTIGANYYFYGQRLKFTLDGTLLPQGSPFDAPAMGILADRNRLELVGRALVQLLL